jgi:hypothetical protein
MVLFRNYYAREKQQIAEFALKALGRMAESNASSLHTQHLIVTRKLACLRTMPIKYLDVSALKMVEALLANDPRMPDFPAGESVWLQPLGPLTFHGSLVRGLALYYIFEPSAITALLTNDIRRSSHLPAFPANASEREVDRLIKAKKQNWLIEVIVDAPPSDLPVAGVERDLGKTLVLGEYNGQSHCWESTAASVKQCPTGRCQIEHLGAQEIYLNCPSCQQELDRWGCWLKTLFWVMAGKFRRPSDIVPFETFIEKVAEAVSQGPQTTLRQRGHKDKPGKAQIKHEHHVTRVAFDGSYFRPAKKAPGSRPSRYETHLVLTTEEALQEGALEVDLDGVLIKDWSSVRGYWRETIGKYHQYIEPKERRSQLISLSTWKARQKKREFHETQKIIASAYQQQVQ